MAQQHQDACHDRYLRVEEIHIGRLPYEDRRDVGTDGERDDFPAYECPLCQGRVGHAVGREI